MLELFDPHSLVFALAAFAALAGTFLAYGLTELVGGYGFLDSGRQRGGKPEPTTARR